MADKRSTDLISFSSVVSEIQTLMDRARAGAARHVNQELLAAYWKTGEVIVRYEQNDQVRAAYREKTLLQLSRVLTREIGKGFHGLTSIICGSFIWTTQNSRQCLEN